MGRRPLLVLSLLACVFAAFPALADAKKRARASSPVVKSVSPKKVRIGQTLTIRGKNFVKGSRKNSVVFSNSRRAAVFVRAGRSSTRTLKVKLPEKLTKLLLSKNGRQVGTRLRLRIISRRAGRRLSTSRISPLVYPEPGKSGDGGSGGGTGPAPTSTGPGTTGTTPTPCASDNDLLADDVENAIGTNRCVNDTDGDGMQDGWEYQSALDLNNGGNSLPYPGKRPYPNPLDKSDADNDYDGDGLYAWQEHALWSKFSAHSIPLGYSAGKQYSASEATPANGSASAHLDWRDDDSPFLADDERDADGDRLSNFVEARGPLSGESWWTANYAGETLYHWGPYLGTNFLDADTDGDQVLDGDDDQDYDDWNNVAEISRIRGNGLSPDYYIQPFNPCMPDPTSRSCSPYFKPGLTPHPPSGCYVDGVTVVPIQVDATEDPICS